MLNRHFVQGLIVFFTLLQILVLPATQLMAQCEETEETKVLLVGDSWAFFMGIDQTINNAFEKWGHSDKIFFTNLTLAENGAETDDFQRQDKQDEIQAMLDSFPSIEFVHLSIGGNDVLGSWHVDWSQGQTDTLAQEVFDRLVDVIEFIKSAKPGIRILWSGYCYPNFEEVIESSAPFQTIHPFYGTWEGMGFPSFAQINKILNDFSADAADYVATEPQVDFVNTAGLLQYIHGQPDSLLVAPFGSYPPESVPLPNGDPNYPSPMNTMRDYVLTRDCFHLSAEGYLNMLEYHTQKYYHKLLMDDLYLLPSGGTNNGSVGSNGTVAQSLQVGEFGGENFSTILSFDPSAMLDTTLAAASIFVRTESINGNNPLNDQIELSIIDGNFGSTQTIEAADFSAQGDETDMACIFGSNGGEGHWLRFDLPVEFLPLITSNSSLQFKFTSSNASNALITFSDDSDPELAPVLNLKYGTVSTSGLISKPVQEELHQLYPNPSAGVFQIERAEELHIQSSRVIDLSGRTVLEYRDGRSQFDLSNLPNGTYTLILSTSKGNVHLQAVLQ